MTKTKTTGNTSAPEPAPQSEGNAAIALRAHDELAELGDVTFDVDGLEEIDHEDIRIAVKVFNMKGKDANGRAVPPDAYYDTIDEDVKFELNAVALYLHKTNQWQEYDNAQKKNVTHCRSFDRVTGTMADGTKRQCEGCPDAEWFTDPETKKRKSNCGPVYNVFFQDRETQMPFVIRFKKTSLPVIKAYNAKHHVGRRPLPGGKRGNYPLFSFAVKIACKMSDDGKYSLPVLTRGAVLSREEIFAHQGTAEFLKNNMKALVEKAEKQDSSTESEPDTSFDTDKFNKESDEGKTFVEAPAD